MARAGAPGWDSGLNAGHGPGIAHASRRPPHVQISRRLARAARLAQILDLLYGSFFRRSRRSVLPHAVVVADHPTYVGLEPFSGLRREHARAVAGGRKSTSPRPEFFTETATT